MSEIWSLCLFSWVIIVRLISITTVAFLAIALSVFPLVESAFRELQSSRGSAETSSARTGEIWFEIPNGKLVDSPGVDRPKDVDAAIHHSAQYLRTASQKNGQFTYRRDLESGQLLGAQYNLMRHAGSMNALADYYDWYPNPETVSLLLAAVRFLQDQSLQAVPGHDELVAAWSNPTLTAYNELRQAKLGTTGTVLSALIRVEWIRPGTIDLAHLRKLARFILFMQKTDGSFYSSFVPGEGGKRDTSVPFQFPSQAVLGTLSLYELDPEVDWLNAAAKGLDHLSWNSDSEGFVSKSDYWSVLAIRILLEHYEEIPSPPTSRCALVAYVVQICENILQSQPQFPRGCREHGCFTMDGRTGPTAMRLQALIAALSFLPDHEVKLCRRIENAVSVGIEFLVGAQIREGIHLGAMPRAVRKLPRGHVSFTRDFNRRANEVRINDVHHALQAFMAYDHLSQN